MINHKYKPFNLLKERNGKRIQQAELATHKKTVILKSYPLGQSDSIANEIKVFEKLKEPHLNGFPEIQEVFESDGRLYLVLQQLGPNIEFLRLQCGGRLSLKTTLTIGIQLIERLQCLHSSGILHGEIKPDNLLVGLGPKLKHKIYLIDFELSHPYMVKGKHIEEENQDTFSGSIQFSSAHANSKKNISRRDEIESLLYCMIYLLKG